MGPTGPTFRTENAQGVRRKSQNWFYNEGLAPLLEIVVVSGIRGAAVGGMAGNPLAGADALAFRLKTRNHVDWEVAMAAMEKIDWSDCPLVEVKPGVQSGAPVLRGTRMPADAIVDNFDYGVSAAEIAEQFEIPPERVEAILTYAQSHRFAHPV